MSEEDQEVLNWMWDVRYSHIHMCDIDVTTLTNAAIQEFGEDFTREKLEELAIQTSNDVRQRIEDHAS